MQIAIRLAQRAIGRVAPNPPVGCVLVREGRVVGRGATGPAGRPHAEAIALAQAGAAARGATAYVSLEPCAHHGKTPPCADALIAAGIARVVVGAIDPDPRVRGRGIDRLEAAGIAVSRDVERTAAAALIAGFSARLKTGRPVVTLKLASSADSRIATRIGESKWITGPAARRAGHFLRASHDVVMTGTGTLKADDPALTCRLPGLEQRSPARVVLDSRLETSGSSRLMKSANDIETVIITTENAPPDRADQLRALGAAVLRVASTDSGRVSPAAALAALGERGITSVLLESGGILASSFLVSDLVDELAWFRASMLIGGDGVAALAPIGVGALAGAIRMERISVRVLGEDVMETYRLRP